MILLRKEGDAFLSVYASGGLTCRRVDRAALKAVAAVSDINGAFRIELKEEARLDNSSWPWCQSFRLKARE